MGRIKRSALVAIDVGTTNLTMLVFDVETRKIIDFRTAPNHRFDTGDPYAYAQDPLAIESQVMRMLAMVTEPIASICVTGQVHGILYHDATGKALSPLYTWLDQRGMVEIDGISTQRLLFGQTGCHLPSGYGLLTHYANRRLQQVPDGAAGFCGILEYVTGRLVGSPVSFSDPSCLGTYGAFDPVESKFDQRVLDVVLGSFGPSFLGPSDPFSIAGETVNGIPVAYAVGDNQAGFFGMVPNWHHAALVSMGTSGQVSLFSKTTDCPESMELRPFLGQGYLHVGATLSAGKSYETLERLFASVLSEAGFDVDDEAVFEMMKRAAGKVEDPTRLQVDPRFAGSRQDPFARGSFTGIALDNLTVGNLVRSMVDGIVGELHSFVELKDMQVDSLVAIGSSVRRNGLFRESLERIFKVVPLVPDVSDGAALGSAMIGGVSAGVLDLVDVGRIVADLV